MPSGKKENFNYAHSSLRNVIERSLGVLKMKWRVLLNLPSYPMPKQSKIIMGCMALHNFIRESYLGDKDFDLCDHDENYVPEIGESSTAGAISQDVVSVQGEDDYNMNEFREWICDGLFSRM